MKYQLATINRSWDSILDKNLNLVFGQRYICTYRQPECSLAPWPQPKFTSCTRTKWAHDKPFPPIRDQNLPKLVAFNAAGLCLSTFSKHTYMSHHSSCTCNLHATRSRSLEHVHFLIHIKNQETRQNTKYTWARPWENVSYAICKQQRHRLACASTQSSQRLCCSLPRQNDTS